MVYALDVPFCQRCRIGTIDEQGLCRLCGAPARPPTRLGRLAEAGGGLISALLHPAVLAALFLVGVLVVAAIAATSGAPAQVGLPRVGPGVSFDPQAALTGARGDPLGAALRFLLPVLVQALLFGLLLGGLLFLLMRRRRQESPPPERRPAG